jgi:hypothetical protein
MQKFDLKCDSIMAEVMAAKERPCDDEGYLPTPLFQFFRDHFNDTSKQAQLVRAIPDGDNCIVKKLTFAKSMLE